MTKWVQEECIVCGNDKNLIPYTSFKVTAYDSFFFSIYGLVFLSDPISILEDVRYMTHNMRCICSKKYSGPLWAQTALMKNFFNLFINFFDIFDFVSYFYRILIALVSFWWQKCTKNWYKFHFLYAVTLICISRQPSFSRTSDQKFK